MYTVKEVKNINWACNRVNTTFVKDENGKILPELAVFALYKGQFLGSSDRTVKTYIKQLKYFFEVINDDADLGKTWREINEEEMEIYLRCVLIEGRGLKTKSMKVVRAALSTFYEVAYETGMLAQKKRFSFKSVGKKNMNDLRARASLTAQYLTDKDFNEVLAGVTAKTPALRERDELVLNLGYHAGLRSEETTSSRNLTITELRKLIRVSKRKNKETIALPIVGKGGKVRRVVIKPVLFRKIDNFIQGRHKQFNSDLLICNENGQPLGEHHAGKVFRNAKNNNNNCIEERWDAKHFHSLRHTYATNLVGWCLANGYSPKQVVKERLGHSNYRTSLIYIHFDALMHNRVDILEKLNLDKNRYKAAEDVEFTDEQMEEEYE